MKEHAQDLVSTSTSLPTTSAESSGRFRVSRRQFLRAAGAGTATAAVAGVGGIGAVAFSSSRAFAQGSWDQEADIVVVGSGGAASSAALNAHELGDEVVILEKSATYGGTTGKSGGIYWIPNNSLMRAAGLEDPKEDAIRYMARCSYPTIYRPDDPQFGLPDWEYSLIEAFYDNGPAAIDKLDEIGALKSTSWMSWDTQFFPDYYAQYSENKAPRGRGVQPLTPEGKPGAGAEIIRQMKAAIDERTIPVLMEHRVQAVVLNDAGEVVGVEAVAGGATVSVRARKAVIFGSGGFTHNPEMRLHYLRGPIFGGCAVPTNEGDLVTIATEVGVELANMNNGWWAQIPVEQALANTSTPSDIFGMPGDSLIQVNRYGVRVVDEKIQYNERTQAHFVWDPVVGEYPNRVLFMIYDQRTADIFAGTYPLPAKGVEAPYVISADTWADLTTAIAGRLEELAEAMGPITLADDFSANLAATVERFNGFADAGKDDDFHRGEAPIEMAFHGPAREGNDKSNPTMYPFSDTGPYYAILVGAGTLDTKGGPKVNTKAQMLNTKGEPVPGLYGAGNCIASPAGQAYWAGGGTIGPALTFGYIAAVNATTEPAKEA